MAEAILSILITPITEIFKCLIPSIKRRIDYLIHCEEKIEDLKKKLKDLEDIKGSIQSKVDAAERNLDSVNGVVTTWLQRVDVETNIQNDNNKMVRLVMSDEATEMINQQRCKGWCCCGSVGASYDLGREAHNKIVIINELHTQGRSIISDDIISDRAMITSIEHAPSFQDFEVFASRESVRNKVMAALKDKGTNRIGVHGMGGVGKTTLMEQIRKQVKDENLFDDVAFTTVSQNIDLKQIQGEVAEGLGCSEKLKQTDNIKTRAELLYARLNQDKRRTLVILDDLWSTQNLLNLSDVGIHHKAGCCKVVITTRSMEVCNLLDCQININVVVLSEKESWNLFKRSAGGDVVDSDFALQSVAKEVAKECGGLPLALVTLGKALIKKDRIVWEDTLRQLKVAAGSSNNFTCIGITKESIIYTSIKLSYDLLGNEILKRWFLLCCLFPEDYRIGIDDLMPYVIEDDEIFEDLRNLKQVKSRLHTVLDKLKVASLLLAVEEDDVRMHDIVRDVAILIASEEGNNKFIVKAGLGLKSWEDTGIPGSSSRSNTGRCLRRLSLMNNHITELPDQPELPHLLSLSLRGNTNIRKIPDSFFQSMTSLTTLDLSETRISSLPSSLLLLVNLRSLYLDCVGHFDISGIGNLTKLIVLSLQRIELQVLPEEMGRLTNLRMLDLSWNHLHTMTPDVISRMTRLECLKVDGGFNKWELEGWGNGTNASLAEVASLRFLTDLELSLKIQKTSIDQERVEEIQLFRIDSTNKSNECKLRVSHPTAICDSIKVLLGRQRVVHLEYCKGLKSVGQLVSLGVEFKNTKSLRLENWNEMEYFLSTSVSEEEEHIPRNAFVSIEKLIIKWMCRLKQIVHGRRPIPMGMFDNLKELDVYSCERMVTALSSHLVRRLPNLEKLSISQCEMLKDGVFNFENVDDDDDEEGSSVVMCSKVTEIRLSKLANLETIWKGIIPLGCVENLKRLHVDRCGKLRYLFSAATARRLQQLEKLEISCCGNMASIIKTETREIVLPITDADDQLCFPNLKVIFIENCGVLEQLWDNDMKPTSLLIPQLDEVILRPESIRTSLFKVIK